MVCNNVSLIRNGVNYVVNGDFTSPSYSSTYSSINTEYVKYPSTVSGGDTLTPLDNWSGEKREREKERERE